ncbi:hypothetical protein [Nitrosopumilus sp.]|uniref:hypothetical protein n=1 Tax=Nitrosopumilus sp. TaxID=2024843 RepID=UPI00292E0E3A|nr:hypothetical protein [Nitrosopumilus sp.]
MKLNLKSSHHGFVFSIPLMIGIAFIIFAALIGISQGFVEVGGLLVPELITDMPTFFDYDETTGEMILDGSGNPAPNERIDLYWLLVSISVIILVAVAMVAVLGYIFETVRWIHPGTALGIIKKIILFLIAFLVFPFVWDIYAIIIENFSLFLLDPFGSGVDPADRTLELWRAMGSVIPVDIFDLDAWSSAFVDPGSFAQGMMKDVFLALFKGFAVMFMTAMMFIISTIRILLTIIIAMSIPLLLTLSLIPMFRSVKDMLVKNLIGLSIAPVFSALVLTTGLAYLDSTTLPAMQDWFASLAVGFLAVFFPVMLAPMLGNIVTQVGQMMSTAIMAGSIVGGMVGQGALGGVAKSLGGGANTTAAAMGAMGAGSAGFTGLGTGNSGIKPLISSQELGMAGMNASAGKMSSTPTAFGNNSLGNTTTPGVIEQTPMSFGEKFKTGVKGGLYGGLGGLGAGSLAAAGHALHADRLVRPMVHDIQGAGLGKAFEAGQISVANHSLQDIDSHMRSLEPVNYTPIIEKTIVPETGQNAPIVMNPGEMVNEMDYVGTGQDIIENPGLQQEYLEMQHNQIKGFDKLNANVQMKADTKLLEQLHEHPGSAGKMFESMKNYKDKITLNRKPF